AAGSGRTGRLAADSPPGDAGRQRVAGHELLALPQRVDARAGRRHHHTRRLTLRPPGDLLRAIRIPATWAGAQFYFEKVRDRQVWDFPLVNVASAMKASGGTIQAARIAVGAVAARPLRLTAVEAAIVGQPRNEETAARAGALAIEGAQPLR